MLYGMSSYVPGYEPGVHDVEDDRRASLSVWTKGGSTAVVIFCLFPSDRCFIKVSITYQTMPALLKRTVMVPFINVLSQNIGNGEYNIHLMSDPKGNS